MNSEIRVGDAIEVLEKHWTDDERFLAIVQQTGKKTLRCRGLDEVNNWHVPAQLTISEQEIYSIDRIIVISNFSDVLRDLVAL